MADSALDQGLRALPELVRVDRAADDLDGAVVVDERERGLAGDAEAGVDAALGVGDVGQPTGAGGGEPLAILDTGCAAVTEKVP